MTLSKSDYLLYLKHPAWLWLKKKDKHKLAPVSENLQAMFDEGSAFEAYAEKLFPSGVRIGFSEFSQYRSMPERTERVIGDGAKIIFQGRFEHGPITCICDVVVVTGDRAVDLYEIKSSTEVKEIHVYDLAFQKKVLTDCGYRVGSVKVLCVSREYVREGNIDPAQLVLEQDVTGAVHVLEEATQTEVEAALKVIRSPVMPDLSPARVRYGSVKDWLDIYRTLVPVAPGSIYDLCRVNAEQIGEFEKQNIRRIADIPVDTLLKPQQNLQIRVTRENKAHIEKKTIQKFLSDFAYPLYFLDYETFASAVPAFDGLRPYQQVPFQYSLHVIEKRGAEAVHFGYLHTEHSNPVAPLSKSLQSHIGSTGTVLVWYEQFEKSRNTEMGELINSYKPFYEQVNARVIDLMAPFAQGWYAHKDFLGSASIKYVLPVLAPELSYKTLEIQEGSTAQRLWMETVLSGGHADEKEKIFADLDAYCTLDTLAMVRIYEKLLQGR